MKTSELTGAALDWLVAKCEGLHGHIKSDGVVYTHANGTWYHDWNPSTRWAQGGPIIERERISTQTTENHWEADMTTPEGKFIQAEGPTPLIAAMRCYVALRLGDEVEIPEELT